MLPKYLCARAAGYIFGPVQPPPLFFFSVLSPPPLTFFTGGPAGEVYAGGGLNPPLLFSLNSGNST